MAKLTPKRERFAYLLVYGLGGEMLSQVDAHEEVFPNRMSKKTRHEAASRLAADSKVIARVAEHHAELQKQGAINLENETRKLEDIYKLAIDKESRNLGVAVRAREAIQRIHGMLDERGKQSDIPPLEERLKVYQENPDYRPPEIDGTVTKLPPMDAAE